MSYIILYVRGGWVGIQVISGLGYDYCKKVYVYDKMHVILTTLYGCWTVEMFKSVFDT